MADNRTLISIPNCLHYLNFALFLSFFLHPHMHEYSKQTQKLVTCSSSKSNRKIVQFTHAFDSFRHNHSIPFHFFSFFPLHYLSVFVFSIQYLLFKIFRFILFFSVFDRVCDGIFCSPFYFSPIIEL